jgi:hypothetical protein
VSAAAIDPLACVPTSARADLLRRAARLLETCGTHDAELAATEPVVLRFGAALERMRRAMGPGDFRTMSRALEVGDSVLELAAGFVPRSSERWPDPPDELSVRALRPVAIAAKEAADRLNAAWQVRRLESYRMASALHVLRPGMEAERWAGVVGYVRAKVGKVIDDALAEAIELGGPAGVLTEERLAPYRIWAGESLEPGGQA